MYPGNNFTSRNSCPKCFQDTVLPREVQSQSVSKAQFYLKKFNPKVLPGNNHLEGFLPKVHPRHNFTSRSSSPKCTQDTVLLPRVHPEHNFTSRSSSRTQFYPQDFILNIFTSRSSSRTQFYLQELIQDTVLPSRVHPQIVSRTQFYPQEFIQDTVLPPGVHPRCASARPVPRGRQG